jgi:hypothetical protein
LAYRYTDEIGHAIASRMIAGESMRSVLRDPQYPCRRTIQQWMIANPEFRALIQQAYELQGEDAGDEIRDLRVRLLNGEIDERTHREARQSCEFEASHRAPKRWGTRIELDHTNSVGTAGELSEEQIMQRLGEIRTARLEKLD